MLKDYAKVLDPILDEATRIEGVPYFEKYWLNGADYLDSWLFIQNQIFDCKTKYLPDLMFNEGFELYPLVGGDIFVSEKDFLAVIECSKKCGDAFFVMVQNRHVHVGNYDAKGEFDEHPLVRFKYPSNIAWAEIMSGGHAATEHFNNGCKDYFVFGDSGNWGRYVGNSYVKPGNEVSSNPLNIMGFKKEYSELFGKNFEEIRRLEPQITPEILLSEWLPDTYKQSQGIFG